MLGIPKLNLKKEVWILLSSVLIIHIAAYLIVPLFPILLRTEKNMNTTQVGFIIGTGSLFFQLGSIVAGFISDRLASRYMIIVGNFCQLTALLGLGLSTTFPLLLFFSALNGVGTGIYIPTTKAAISYVASEKQITTAFSLRSVASNIGVSIAGIVILFSATNRNFYYSAFIYALLIIVSWFMLPEDCGNEPCPSIPLKDYILIFKDQSFMLFSAIAVLIWALHTQLAFLVPLRGQNILDNPNVIGTIWTIISMIVIFIQPIISRIFLEKYPPYISLAVGVILLGIGITLIGFANSFYFLLMCAVFFIFGEMFVMPTIDIITSIIGNAKLIGAYFAISNISSGIGAALGNFVSGRMIDTYNITGSLIPWIIYGSYSLFLAFLLFLFNTRRIIKKRS